MNVVDLLKVVMKYGIMIECFVEIDCGVGCCGVKMMLEVFVIVKVIVVVLGLCFMGI